MTESEATQTEAPQTQSQAAIAREVAALQAKLDAPENRDQAEYLAGLQEGLDAFGDVGSAKDAASLRSDLSGKQVAIDLAGNQAAYANGLMEGVAALGRIQDAHALEAQEEPTSAEVAAGIEPAGGEEQPEPEQPAPEQAQEQGQEPEQQPNQPQQPVAPEQAQTEA